jgi:GDPmannose 4,6-dehydratase
VPKISRAVARIALGLQRELTIGDIDVRRDWGFAGDFVAAMHAMLRRPEPDDYVIATGVSHSVRDVLDVAFARVGIDDWTRYVRHDEELIRPAEMHVAVGDSSRAADELGWRPTVDFDALVRMMVDHDLERERSSRMAPSSS